MKTILVIEDDAAMLMGLVDNLKAEGHKVLSATDGEKGFQLASSSNPDLVVLDLMLPRMNGYEICDSLRREGYTGSILMLTARTAEIDAVLGFRVGADDYVRKPFGVREFLARVDALLQRRSGSEPESLSFGPFRIEQKTRRFLRSDRHPSESESREVEIPLTHKEFDLLWFLASRPEHVHSRDSILREVWGYDRLVTPRTIDRFINGLRKKLGDSPSHPSYIETIRDIGYRFRRPG